MREVVETDLVELQVYGLVVGPHQPRPLLLMKDKMSEAILPVALNALEAQILAFGSDRPEGPHGATFEILRDLNVQIAKAQFREIRGNRQILELYYVAQGKTSHKVEVFAESSMSVALGAKAPIFATQKFIDQCRRTPLELGSSGFGQVELFADDKVPPHLVQ